MKLRNAFIDLGIETPCIGAQAREQSKQGFTIYIA
jgi:hypothetical protein